MRALWAKFTDPQGAVLRQLSERGDSGGLALVKGSHRVLNRFSIYLLLSRLEDKGLVDSRYEGGIHTDGQIRRRLFRITELGKQALAGTTQ